MKEEIYKICTQLNDGQIAVTQAQEQLLLLFSVSGRSEQLKCYHYNYEWKSDGQGGNLKYCNDCKCYV
jgi:hypothetical protein